MLREDKPFELLFDPEEDTESGQASQLYGFVLHCLAKNIPYFRPLPPDTPSSGVPDAIAPAESRHNLFTFGIKPLLARKNSTKTTILPPDSVSRYVLGHPQGSSPALQLKLLRDIQEALHASNLVLVFNAAHVTPLLALGARNLLQSPMPAIRGKRVNNASNDLLIINHLRDRKTLHSLTALHAAKFIDLSDKITNHSQLQHASADAKIHLHIGSPHGDHALLRIIDSYAQGKLVIHLNNNNPQQPTAADPQMQVKHNISGFCISKIKDAIPAVKTLLTDAAMADLFRRNGDRIVNMFNASIEERILGALV